MSARPPAAATAAPRRRIRWVAPLLAAAAVVLIAALWSGLVHLGLPVPKGGSSLHAGHGPMMILGFLGTVISLERSVALGRTWAYIAPAAAAAGGLAVLGGAPDRLGPLLLTVAGLALCAVYISVHRIQASLHNGVLAAGAVCWVVAGSVWLAGWSVPEFVPWLAGFLVLTITGERLELSRLTGASHSARLLFLGAAGLFGTGLLVSLFTEPAGVRIAGAGLLCLVAWLARHDIARRTIRTRGLTRYMAAALLSGYCWLAVGGVLWIAIGRMHDGKAYDAMLHAVFLGFVISMIFAHAPVIVPAVLGRPLPYRPVFYVPLVLLHLSLALRLLGGDAAGNVPIWRWSGVLNEIALLLFVGLAARSAVRARHIARPAPPRGAHRPLHPPASPTPATPPTPTTNTATERTRPFPESRPSQSSL